MGELERVRSLLQKQRELRRLCWQHFDNSRFCDAKLFANKLLKFTDSPELPESLRRDANAIHCANTVLGLISLEDRDIASAKFFLQNSISVNTSPQMRSFGPNLSLAQSLLESGERQIVIDFLAACGVFWDLGSSRLENWILEIENGGIPDFRVNLEYGKLRKE